MRGTTPSLVKARGLSFCTPVQRDLSLPAAVVIGSAIIGAGLYFGLRSQAPATPAPAAGASDFGRPRDGAVAGTGAAAPPPALPPRGGGLVMPGAPEEVRQRAENAAREALLAEKKARFIPECWAPAIKKQPSPATSKHVFSIGFDAQGREMGRGLKEIRGQTRGDVSQCLRAFPMGLRISPPPGVPIVVEIPIEFP